MYNDNAHSTTVRRGALDWAPTIEAANRPVSSLRRTTSGFEGCVGMGTASVSTTHCSRTFRPKILPRCDSRSLRVNGLSRHRNVRTARRKSRNFLGAKVGEQAIWVCGQARVKPSSSGVSGTIPVLY